MEEGKQRIEYSSADIGKKPKAELITNIEKENKAKKFLKVPDNFLIIISSITALIAVVGLAITCYLLFIAPSSSEEQVAEDNRQVVLEVEDEIEPVAPNMNGQDFDKIIADIESRIAEAETAGNKDLAYRLNLLKAKAFIDAGLGEIALIDILLPIVETNLDNNSVLYDSYYLIIKAYNSLGDTTNEKDFIGRILNLPAEVFPNQADDTWREYYEQRLKELTQ